MSLRHIVYALLAANAQLTTMVANRIFDVSAVGPGTDFEIPEIPFVITNHGADTGGPRRDATVEDRTVDVYFYGPQGDFTIVEQGLRYVKQALHDKTTVYTDLETGLKTYLIQSRYQSTSSDLFDDIFRANFRYATYRLVGNTP